MTVRAEDWSMANRLERLLYFVACRSIVDEARVCKGSRADLEPQATVLQRGIGTHPTLLAGRVASLEACKHGFKLADDGGFIAVARPL